MTSARGQNLFNLVLGLWLFLAPWTLEYSLFMTNVSVVNWNFWIVGAAITISAALALRDLRPWEEWTNLGLGAWVFISPWALGYSQVPNLFWNSILVGAAVIVLSAAAIPVAQKLVHQRIR